MAEPNMYASTPEHFLFFFFWSSASTSVFFLTARAPFGQPDTLLCVYLWSSSFKIIIIIILSTFVSRTLVAISSFCLWCFHLGELRKSWHTRQAPDNGAIYAKQTWPHHLTFPFSAVPKYVSSFSSFHHLPAVGGSSLNNCHSWH